VYYAYVLNLIADNHLEIWMFEEVKKGLTPISFRDINYYTVAVAMHVVNMILKPAVCMHRFNMLRKD
jgi:hypothetical protein